MPLVERPVGAQLRRAVKVGARFALIVGREELKEGRFTLKELSTERQETLDEGALLARVRSSRTAAADRCN
jgi:histidyl-tRNA synthetase